MNALLVGYGKMGRAIEAVLVQRGHGVTGRVGRREEGDFLEGNRASGDDVAFEFTAPDAAPRLVPVLLARRIPVLSGTTGWDTAEAVRIAKELSVPFLHSANFSLGVAALRRAVAAAAAALAPFSEYEPGILERHHSKKKDAPSGTALSLASALEAASGRSGTPIASLRQGGAPGEHRVFFEGTDETLELVHRARSRAIFAQGAVCAAEWLLKSGREGPVTFDDFFEAMTKADAAHGNGRRNP